MSTMCFPRYFSRHGKCGNGTRWCVSPGDQETQVEGARGHARYGEGRAGPTGPAQQRWAADPKEPAQKWAGTRAGAGAAPGEQPEELITVHNCAGSGKRRRTACTAWAGVISAASRDSERRGRDSEQRHGSAEGRKRVGRAVGDADTSTAEIKVTGIGSGDFVGGLEARGYPDGQIDSGFHPNRPPGAAFVQNLSRRRGQRSVIPGGNRGIQGSESEIKVARIRKNHIAKAPSEGWVQRAGGASVVEEERG
ncbi:hypothetical protein B0H14DRAFT_3134229 [Mycena olivaceomarginata]|nr:hypothetical protein B0H14DRAFT_3134229 [Mycena olivaceomarginata]